MLTFYYVCFGVGVGYTVISFMLGGLLGSLNINADIGDFNADAGDIGADAGDFNTDSGATGSPSPLKPVIIAMFLTVFGGVGIMTLASYGAFIAFSLSGTAGLAAAWVFYTFVIIPLYKMQNTSTIEKLSVIGHAAKVTEVIPQGKFGKITYFVNGNTYSAPAKSESGDEIGRHVEVEIVGIERNTFFVRAKEKNA